LKHGGEIAMLRSCMSMMSWLPPFFFGTTPMGET